MIESVEEDTGFIIGARISIMECHLEGDQRYGIT